MKKQQEEHSWYGEWFIVCRSIWMPSNELLKTTSVGAAPMAMALTHSWCPDCNWWFSTLICCVFGWLCSWGLLYSARDLENRSIVEMTDDEKSDRSIMPLAWCSLPAGALAGAVWYVAMHGIPTVIEVARGMQVEGT